MRPFSSLDPAALKAFYYAAHTLQFTKAAIAASLTQSGVSQHVKKLEEELGVSLFHRDRKKMRLTSAGMELKKYVDFYLDSVNELRETIQESEQDISGLVRYAMPDSCLYTPHFPLLLERRERDFPLVTLQVKICPSDEVLQSLRKREVDFGFVAKAYDHPEFKFQHFATEEYLLVAASKKLLDFSEARDLLETKFVAYPGMGELFEHWFGEEFPRNKAPSLHRLRVVAEINSLKGALTLVEKGVGCAIFQRQCVQSLLDSGSLFSYGAKKKVAAKNKIFVATLKGEIQPARVRVVMDAFAAMKG